MKEYVKKFNTLETVEGYKMDNPFITVVVPTGQKLACVDGEYMTVEDNLAVLVHMVPKPANNEFYYRTVLNEPVYPSENTLLGENDTILNIVSNTYDDSFKGYRMVLDGDLVKVGDNAFYKTCGFTYICFPDSLERLCYRSFRQCSDQWMYIHFGSGIKYIDDEAFHADQIKNLVFPSSLISVGNAFWYSGISHDDGILRLPAGISYGQMFPNAWGFNTLILEEGITEIGGLFNGGEPSDVKHVILPTTLRIIGNKVFGNNPSLTEITLPAGLQSIGDYSFNVTGLTSIEIPNSVTNIGYGAFSGCSALTSVTIGNSVKSIGTSAFYNCSSLTSVTIPDSVTSIVDYTFYGCTSLKSLTIGNSVTSIGKSAFYNCSGLTSVTIPDSVTSIGQYAFRGCNGLKSLTIGNSVTSIGQYAFRDCSGLTSVIIGNGVSNIDKGLFYGCSSLDSVTIPDSVTSIGKSAFYNCTGLTSVTIPNSVKNIGDYTFGNCGGLTSITIPNSVTSIGASAFSICTGLTSVYIPDSITSIGEYAFAGLTNIKSITVDVNNKVYDSRNNCNAIIEKTTNKLIVGNIDITTIPDTVTTIGYTSFAMNGNNTQTNSVDIPASVTAIEKWAFELIPTLTTVTCRATNPPTLDALAFEGSSNIAHIYVPADSVDAYKAAANWSAFASIIEAIPSVE